MIHSERAIRLAMLADLGQDPGPLDREEQAYFDAVVSDIARIRAAGGQVDLPFEAPDPDGRTP